MNPFEAYQKYLAMKQHFTQKGYDYFKYNGKTNASVTSFETRKDKYYFHKLSKKDDVENFLMVNLIDNPHIWIGELFDEKAEAQYLNWKKKQESLSYIFKTELNALHEDLNKNFKVEDGQHPYILKQYLRKNISLETFVIVDDVLKFAKYFNKNIEDTIIWPGVEMKMIKYRAFLKYDKFKMRKILKEKFYAET
jgi:hypothetical protein